MGFISLLQPFPIYAFGLIPYRYALSVLALATFPRKPSPQLYSIIKGGKLHNWEISIIVELDAPQSSFMILGVYMCQDFSN